MNKKVMFAIGVNGVILLILLIATIVMINKDGNKEQEVVQADNIEETEDETKKESDQVVSAEEIELEETQESNVIDILIMGVDEGGFDSARSDVMMLASIDVDTKTVKLTSVMRDTLAYIPTSDTYQKLNHSYMEGGPQETMKAFNENFDLQIENYVVFDYEAVKKVVDFVGGYPADVTVGEAKDMGISPGQQVLKGDLAVDYMRVRKNSGGDAGRNKRQRDMIAYVMEEAKDMGKFDIITFALKLLPEIRTSYSIFDIRELVDLYGVIKDDLDVEQYSFPFDYKGKILSDRLWYAVPKTMKYNVETLHGKIYKEDSYVPSNKVTQISEVIESMSGVHLYE